MPEAVSNKFLLPLISGHLLIDADFALDTYLTFLQELSLIQSGVPYTELGMSARRHMQLPELYEPQANGFAPVVHDRWRLYSAESVSPGSVAIIKISGVLRSESAASTRGVDVVERDLRQAYMNENIDAVVLDVNSGGGEATAAWRLNNAVRERNKPVVAHAHIAGSGAYLAITGADEIISANAGARLGSIGALYSIDRRVLTEHAENFVDIYADQSINKNAEIRAALSGDFGPLKREINKVATDFQNLVKNSRELHGDAGTIEHTLSGPMFSASESARRGLSDMTGNLLTAVSRASLWAKRRKKMSK